MQDVSLVAPESYELDSALLARPGNDEIQLDLFLDYASNVALYPKFQEYFRTKRPPLLAVWGNGDPFFLPPGAEALSATMRMRKCTFTTPATSRLKHVSRNCERDSRLSGAQTEPASFGCVRTLSSSFSSRSGFAISKLAAVLNGATAPSLNLRKGFESDRFGKNYRSCGSREWAMVSSWKDVFLRLEREGLRVVAAPIPLTSLGDDAPH